ncbi:hypothetical protein [Brevundimonas sp. R86498]|uniref:hypothetical protein n=1 Tax=Brevundimonas sp. R86498 TaxID=3093845 RepID=UPI0037C61E0C
MFRILIPAVAALGLVALAARPGPADADPMIAVHTPVMSWSVHHEGALAKLTYGVAHSDQLALMVTCMPGDTRAVVYGDMQPEGARLIEARHQVDPLSGGEAVEARLSLRDPWLTSLAERGRTTVVGEAGRFQLTASRQERRLVADFLAYCAPGRI